MSALSASSSALPWMMVSGVFKSCASAATCSVRCWLQLPLALQAVGKLLAHSLQGLQRGRKFPDARVVYVNSFGVLAAIWRVASSMREVSAVKVRTVRWVVTASHANIKTTSKIM